MTKTLLIAFPTMWDDRQIRSCATIASGRFTTRPLDPTDFDCPSDLDPVAWAEATARAHRGTAHGILSSSDYPGATLAGAVATANGWAGSTPEAVIGTSHKYYSRLTQRRAVPDATPGFHLVRPDSGIEALRALPFPIFVKPVKGAFSVHSRRVDSAEALHAFLHRDAIGHFVGTYLEIFHRLVAHYTNFEVDGRAFLAEEILHGDQVTVEGYVTQDEVGFLGIVDSVLHPETNSFIRFDYPSRLDAAVQTRMRDIARDAILAHGLRQTLFNVEMMHDPETGAIRILEINPRICGQFADLYEKVDGVNGYDVALCLAAGEAPPRAAGGPFPCAASVPLRVFEPVRVLKAPDAQACAALEAEYDGTRIWSECIAGDVLSDFEGIEDGRSARYGVINLGAEDPDAIGRSLTRLLDRLGFSFERI